MINYLFRWSTQWIFGTHCQFHLLFRLHFVDRDRSEECTAQKTGRDSLCIVLELRDESAGNVGLLGEDARDEHVLQGDVGLSPSHIKDT